MTLSELQIFHRSKADIVYVSKTFIHVLETSYQSLLPCFQIKFVAKLSDFSYINDAVNQTVFSTKVKISENLVFKKKSINIVI